MSRIGEATKKYPSINISELSESDPSGNNKYIDWMAKHVLAGESLNRIRNAVAGFHKALPRLESKDINNWELEKLEEEICKPSKREKIKKQKELGVFEVYEDDEFVIKRITNFSAMKIYGSGTRWCITQEKHWNSYANSGSTFYIILSSNLKNKNFAKIAVQTNESLETFFWDAADDNYHAGVFFKANININKITNIVWKDHISYSKSIEYLLANKPWAIPIAEFYDLSAKLSIEEILKLSVHCSKFPSEQRKHFIDLFLPHLNGSKRAAKNIIYDRLCNIISYEENIDTYNKLIEMKPINTKLIRYLIEKSSKSAKSSLLCEICKNKDWRIRRACARVGNQSILKSLINDPSYKVREEVARRLKIEDLNLFTNEKSVTVRNVIISRLPNWHHRGMEYRLKMLLKIIQEFNLNERKAKDKKAT